MNHGEINCVRWRGKENNTGHERMRKEGMTIYLMA